MPDRKIIHTIVLAGLFVLVSGVLSPRTPWINTGVNSDAFWLTKAFHERKHDMVLAGDSRVVKGLSPAAMGKEWPGMSIYNFGFDHNAYTKAYLSEMERLLDTSADHPVMVLGISPQSLTPEAAEQNGFTAMRGLGRFERFQRHHLSPYLDFFAPYNLYVWADALRGIPGFRYFQHHYEDGWVASRKEPEDQAYQIRRYQGRFDGNQVSDGLTRQLLARVRQWSLDGIHVFALRLPSSAAMLQLENRQSGFNRQQFVRDFEKAGGHWLEIDPDGYHSYDGSHLREDSAIRLSKHVAMKIRPLVEAEAVAAEERPPGASDGALQ